jgi:hypothetical protein
LKFYFLIDILLFFIIVNIIIYSYKKEIHVKLLDYVKVFIILSLSARFAKLTALYLQKLTIVDGDTKTTVIVIGFLINLLFFTLINKLYSKISKKHIDKTKLQKGIKLTVIIIEVFVLTTFSLYIFIQFTPSKKYIYPTLNKSYTYPYIKKFYIKFLNDAFLNVILDPNSDAENYEKVYKSFKKIIE